MATKDDTTLTESMRCLHFDYTVDPVVGIPVHLPFRAKNMFVISVNYTGNNNDRPYLINCNLVQENKTLIVIDADDTLITPETTCRYNIDFQDGNINMWVNDPDDTNEMDQLGHLIIQLKFTV
jgi:hypothetical protein